MNITLTEDMKKEILRQQTLLGMWWNNKTTIYILSTSWLAVSIVGLCWSVYVYDIKGISFSALLSAASAVLMLKARNEWINRYRDGYGKLINDLAEAIERDGCK